MVSGGVKASGEGVSQIDPGRLNFLQSTEAAWAATVLLSAETRDENGNKDSFLDEGYVLVKVKNSGSSADVDASEVGKWREFDDGKTDLSNVSHVAILADPVDMGEHSGDVQTSVVVGGLLKDDRVFSAGTIDFDNNDRLHTWPF